MSIETALELNVGPLVSGGCHNGVNRSVNITLPYVVYHEVSGEPVTGISNGYLGLTEYRFQVDVFAATPSEAKALALGDIKTAITETTEIGGVLVFQMSGQYSKDARTFKYITEYQIWAE